MVKYKQSGNRYSTFRALRADYTPPDEEQGLPKRAALLLLILLLSACQAIQPKEQGQPKAADQLFAASPRSSASPPISANAASLSNDQLLALAADQRLSGEYEAQAATLQQLLEQQPTDTQARQARFGQAEAALLAGQVDVAAQRLDAFLADGQSDVLAARALFLLARAHEEAGRSQAAIEAYERYRTLHTPLEPYAALRLAAQQQALGQIEAALVNYEYVGQQSIGRARRVEALEALIELYGAAERTDLQLARYRDLLGISQNPEYRPEVLLRAAQLIPGTDEARGWLRELVDKFPLRGEALEAVSVLQADPAGGLRPLQAANVYFAHERYVDALPWFEAALAGQLTPDEQFEARRRHALCLRAETRYDEALHELGTLAQARPIVTGTAQAELDYIQTAGWSGHVQWALENYRRFPERFSQDELAPEALWRVVQLLESQGDIDGSMGTALELGQRYPQSKQAHIALMRAGMHFYQTGQRERAIAAWRLLGDGATGWDSAEGHFWAGNALAQLGQGAEAGARLAAADQAAPQSFYAMRAREILKQGRDSTTPLGSSPSAEEQQATTAWIVGWSNSDAQNIAEEVANSAEVVRARELGALDLRNEARDEWFAARDNWNNDPLRLWYLALQAHAADVPYVALKAAERVVTLSPDKRITPTTPTGLLRLIYPTPYTRVVQREAANFKIDPRIIYALVRQESLFNPDATSWVGARGLGQVMPATGEGIAQNLKVANYSPDQLYRPAVSIRFAAHYISHQLRTFDNNLLAAASAYNGGPGNAARWLEITADRDLFPELIDFRETRDYVKIVYGNWGMYRLLYGP